MNLKASLRVLPWCVAASVLVACAPKDIAPEPIRAVRTVKIAPTLGALDHDYAAEIRARTESQLGFRVGGKLQDRAVNNGDVVRRGQVLARLDPTDLRLGLDAAKAALVAAQTNLDQQEADDRRYKDLRDQGFIGEADLERRDASVKAARAQRDQARAQASAQRNQAAYAALVADAPGVITAVTAEPGQVLAAGAPVVRLAHDGPRDAVFSVPEDRVTQIRALLGKTGGVSLRPWGDAATASLWPATVREVAGAADPATRTFLVKADVGSAALRLGQTATVHMAGTSSSTVHLPLTALFEGNGETRVWLFDRAAGTVKQQTVVVAGALGNDVLIAKGLNQGDEVVVAGTHTLNPGMKVRPYVEPAQASTLPGSAAATSR